VVRRDGEWFTVRTQTGVYQAREEELILLDKAKENV
jgi:hypothetical protein